MSCLQEEKLFTREQKTQFWGDGEWVNESDDVKFEHEGFLCHIRRIAVLDGYKDNSEVYIFGGHLCGYIKLPEGHPYIGVKWSDVDLEMHGGLTYSAQSEDGYWIGFDCAHSGDTIPSMKKIKEKIIREHESYCHKLGVSVFPESYKNMEFCITECKSICEQLKKMEIPLYKELETWI